MKNKAINDLKEIKKTLTNPIFSNELFDKFWAIDYAIKIMKEQIEQEKADNREIVVKCYGDIMKFKSRTEAINFFLEGVANSDGAERERYNNIVNQLYFGKTRCSDEEGSYTAIVYENDKITTADLSTFFEEEEAIEFAKSHNWDEVVDDSTGELVWFKYNLKNKG